MVSYPFFSILLRYEESMLLHFCKMADDDSSVATPESTTTAKLLNQIQISRHYINENEDLRARVNQLEDEADSNRLLARTKHLQAQLDDSNLWNQLITVRINEHQENARQARQEIVALNEQLDALQSQNDDKEQAIASLQGTNLSQEQQIAKLQASLAGEREENDRSRQEIVALENTNGNLQARYDGLEAQANQRIEMSKREIVALNDNVANLGEQLGVLQIQHESLQQEVESSEIEKEQANRFHEQQLAELQAKQRSMNVSLAEKETLVANSNQENELLRQEMARLKIQNSNLLAEKETLNQENETLLRSVASLREEVVTFKHESCNLRAEKETFAAQSKQENKRSRQKMAELERAIGILHAEKEALLEQNDKLAAESLERFIEAYQGDQANDEMLHEVGEMELKLEKLQEEIERKGRVIDRLKNQNKRLRELSPTATGSSVTPGLQSSSVTPAHSQFKRDQSMTATTESSLAESTSPMKKRSKMSHETTRAEPPAAVMPYDDSVESIMNVDDQTATSESSMTNAIVLSDRASHTKLSAKENSKAWLTQLNENYQKYLEVQCAYWKYGWAYLIHPNPPMTMKGTEFLRVHFLCSQDEFRKLFGFTTTNTERNGGNGIILYKPYGLRALLELMGTTWINFRKNVLVTCRFTHHAENPQVIQPNRQTQNIIFYQPDMHPGDHAAYAQLTSKFDGSITSLPRRQRDPNRFDIRAQMKNLITETDTDKSYLISIQICEKLRSFGDKERILDQLNRVSSHSDDEKKALSIMFITAGLSGKARGKDAIEKLASRLHEGNDLVYLDDVFLKYGPTTCVNRGHQTFKDAVHTRVGEYSRARQLKKNKSREMKQVREAVISVVTGRGRFMHEKDGVLQQMPMDEIHQKVTNAFGVQNRSKR